MKATIDIALKDPAKFALTPSELRSRQDFVAQLQTDANEAHRRLTSPGPAGRAKERGDRQNLLGSGTPDSSDLEFATGDAGGAAPMGVAGVGRHAASKRDNQQTIEQQQEQQQVHLEAQDVELGALSKSLGRLDSMGRTINEELRSQSRALDDFSGEVDESRDRMKVMNQVMNKMLKKKDRGKYCCILVLSIILIFLMYAVFT